MNKDVLKKDGSIDKATFVKRWRLVPKDTAAYFAGELCEPTKPIVYYVENTFPPLWKRGVIKSFGNKANVKFTPIVTG